MFKTINITGHIIIGILIPFLKYDPYFIWIFLKIYKQPPYLNHNQSNFNKRQHSLHCAKAHINDIDSIDEVGKHLYLYHLADDMKHDNGFTIAVADTIIDLFDFNTNYFRFKSDYCKTEYKCKNIFANWSKISAQLQKKIIIYYGESGHGKGLVDEMSGFGVKGPLLNAIITQDYHPTSSTDIFDYLTKINGKDHFKYFDINNEIKNKHAEMMHKQLKIPDCMKQYMAVYDPDGSIQSKERICSCHECLQGYLTECKTEKRKTL